MYVWEEGLRETTWEQDCFKFSLENSDRRQMSGVLWKLIPCSWTRMWKRPFSELAWRNSTSRRSADEVDVMVYLPAATCWRGTKGSDRCVHCTSSSTACIQFLSEPEASAARADGEWCVREMERRRWAVRRRSGLFQVAGVSTGEGPPTPTYCMIQWLGLPSRKGDIELLKTVAKCKEQMIFFYDKNITRRVYTAQYG